jgi:hypothetical protein
MPSANRMTTAATIDADEIEGRYAPLGDYTVSFETFKQDADPAPYFVGLPATAASARTGAWSPKVRSHFGGRTMRRHTSPVTPTYAPPGHLPLVTAGTSIVEFSPSADLEATMAVVEKNLLSAGAQV